MADEQVEQPALPAPSRQRPRPPGRVRVFAEAEVKLVRMGRIVAVYRGTYATLRLADGRVTFERGASAEVGEAKLEAERLELDLPADRLHAFGRVRIGEFGAELSGDEATAMPSLTGLRFHRGVRIRTEDKEAAQAIFDSGLV